MERIKYSKPLEHKDPPDSSNEYSLLNPADFFIDQLKEVRRAKNRVWVQTMALEPGHFIDLLVQSLFEADQKGIDVKLVFDSYSDYVTANTFNHLPFLLSAIDREYKNLILERRASMIANIKRGLSTTQTNMPEGPLRFTFFPGVMGRDHKKLTIVDDVAYIGGVNFTPLDTMRSDFMLRTSNSGIVESLSNVFERSFYDLPPASSSDVCDDHNKLIVDSGERGKSLILDTVYNLVDQEISNITIISPYLPIGKLRRKCNQAVSRGVHVQVITSDEKQLGFSSKLSQHVHSFQQEKPLFEVIRYLGTVHAKAIVFGARKAIIGSHNFDELFVRLGTEELGLLTTQPEILALLESLIKQMKNSSS